MRQGTIMVRNAIKKLGLFSVFVSAYASVAHADPYATYDSSLCSLPLNIPFSAHVEYDFLPKQKKDLHRKLEKFEDVVPLKQCDYQKNNIFTCYAHTATALLNYHYKASLSPVARARDIRQVSRVSVISEGVSECSPSYCNPVYGGEAADVLRTILNGDRRVVAEQSNPVDYTAWVECLSDLDQLTMDSAKRCTRRLPPHFEDPAKATTSQKLKSMMSLSGEVDSDAWIEFAPAQVKTPKFGTREDLDAAVWSHFENSKAPIYPINFNFDKTDFESHSVVITGVRKVCCGAECHTEWEILNSYGTEPGINGWFLPESFPNASISYLSAE